VQPVQNAVQKQRSK